MRKAWVAAGLVVACVVVIASCGGPKGQATPKETVDKMFKCMQSGDESGVLDCFAANEEQAELLGSMCKVGASSRQFEQTFKKKFGSDVWNKMQEESGGSRTSFAEAPPLDKAEVKIDGDKATLTMPGEPQPMNLLKKDGVWKIDAADMVPPGGDSKQMTKLFEAMAKAYGVATTEMGKADATAEGVQKKLGEEVMKAMLGGMPDKE